MTDTSSRRERVTRWDVSAGELPTKVLGAPEGSHLFLLPDKTIDGVGIYRDDVAGLVKTLRHHGVDIDFASDGEDRRYLSEYGASDVAAQIALAVASGLTSDLIKVISRAVWYRVRSALGTDSTSAEVGSANVTVRIAEIVRADHETVIRGLEVTSPVADIESILRDAITGGPLTPLPPGTPDASGPQGAPE